MTAQPPHVVIVGGGFGGLNAALGLRRAPVQVTLIDRYNHHLFQPLLYQVATAGLSPADIAVPIRSVLRHQRNTEVLLGEVTRLDAENRQVFLGERAIAYDYLVWAVGSRYQYFGHDEWAAAAPALKTIHDATTIRRNILTAFEQAEMEPDPARQREWLTFVIIGGGPTGVELAGALAELAYKALVRDFRHINPRQARVLLVEAGPRVMGGFPEDLAQAAHQALINLGVEIQAGSRVEAIDSAGVVINGAHMPARNVIWAAGVAANPGGEWLTARVDRGGRVQVEPDLSVPGRPECFVIGDAAGIPGPAGKPLPGLAPVAMQGGWYVADVIRRRVEGRPAPPSFVYRDKGSLATVGRSFAIAQFGSVHLTGLTAWLLWVLVHIFYLIDFENRILVMLQWFWAYMTFRRGARLIIPQRPAP